MKYKLIAIDVDGTLLNSKEELDKINVNAIQRAVQKGVIVVICTGRFYKSARLIAKQMNIRGPMVAYNGAVIRDMSNEKTICRKPLKFDEAMKVYEIFEASGEYYHLFLDDELCTKEIRFRAEYYSNIMKSMPEDDRIKIFKADSLKNVIKDRNDGVLKMVAFSNTPSKLAEMRKQIKNNGIDVGIMSAGEDNLEIVNSSVSKGNALEILSKELGIDRESIIAIGDNENDISMIEFAGVGAAVGNAIDPLKEKADYIAVSNDEGAVADVISRYILK